MSSGIVQATIQAALLSGTSNILAQGIQAYRSERPLVFNSTQLLQFVIFALVATPPNFLWQEYLEEKFPAKVMGPDGSMRLHRTNTFIKFALDQTFAALVNTVLFIAAMGAFQGKGFDTIVDDCQKKTFPLIQDGWKVWPLVSLINFSVVPASQRLLVGSIVGLFWGIYLSLVASK